MGAPPVEAGACQVTMAVLLAENQAVDTPVGALGTVAAALHERGSFQAMGQALVFRVQSFKGIIKI